MIDPNLITTKRVGELPTAAFNTTDLIPHEVGVDLKSGTIASLIAFIAPLVSAMQFEVKRLHVNAAYIAANFDVTGLGINLMSGFAICNGQNGTTNIDGMSGIAYGAVNNVIGQFGGSKDTVVVSHSHTAKISNISGTDNDKFVAQNGGSGGGATSFSGSGTINTGITGESGVGKNYHPYIVELTVMKL